MDVESMKLVPTWRNFRKGRDGILKRLNRFLIDGKVLVEVGRYKSWVRYGESLDQLPILLHLE